MKKYYDTTVVDSIIKKEDLPKTKSKSYFYLVGIVILILSIVLAIFSPQMGQIPSAVEQVVRVDYLGRTINEQSNSLLTNLEKLIANISGNKQS